MGYDRGLTGLGGYDKDPNLVLAGDITIPGKIKTGSLASPTFGGIEKEGRVIGSGAMATTAALTFGNGVPRRVLPDAATTDIYVVFAMEEWWNHSTVGIFVEWTNDHSATGNVRWQFQVRQVQIGDLLSNSLSLQNELRTIASPAANGGTGTFTIASVANGNPLTFNSFAFGSTWAVQITRLGSDGADTHAGPIGAIELSYVRGQ